MRKSRDKKAGEKKEKGSEMSSTADADMDVDDGNGTRSLEEVDRVVRLAKLSPEDLLPATQALKFGTRLLDPSRLLLLEVEVAQAEAIQEGEQLVLRGRPEDGVMLCASDGRSFEVKEAETSNSLVLLESLSLPGDPEAKDGERRVTPRCVNGVYRRYLELRPCRPRLKRLREVLAEKPLSSRADLKDGGGLTMEYLLDNVQASQTEIAEGLADLGAVEVGGRQHMLDDAYRMKVLSDVLKFADENSWSLEQVNREETVETLQELEPKEIVAQVFDQHFESAGDRPGHSLLRRKLSRFFGEYLLQTGSLFRLEDFSTMWAQALPEGVEPDMEQDLAGLAIVDRTKGEGTVRYFPEHALPEDVLERFQALFRAKEKWRLEEIGPFVQKLTTGKLDVKALLTKFARASNEGGVKYFSSKHGK